MLKCVNKIAKINEFIETSFPQNFNLVILGDLVSWWQREKDLP